MDLYQFANRLKSTDQPKPNPEYVNSNGRNDAVAEAVERFHLKLGNRTPVVYKLKAFARDLTLERFAPGNIIRAESLNRKLFAGVNPWTYTDGWGGMKVEALPDGPWEVVGYIDQTYQAGRFRKGHIYLVVIPA